MKQLEKFEYPTAVFMSDVRQDEELDTRICKASAVMRALYYSVVMKRELLKKGKALNFQNSFCSHSQLYGHESWVMTERVRSQAQECNHNRPK